MRPFEHFPAARIGPIRFVLTDVDDTLTDGPRLPAATYAALEQLQNAGLRVIPVTAAPAGWCDLMCRMWPVAAVIGENGGLCFRHGRAKAGAQTAETERHFWAPEAERQDHREKLAALGARIQSLVPGAALAGDQAYRQATLAFRNPGPPVSEQIVAALAEAGASTVVEFAVGARLVRRFRQAGDGPPHAGAIVRVRHRARARCVRLCRRLAQ